MFLLSWIFFNPLRLSSVSMEDRWEVGVKIVWLWLGIFLLKYLNYIAPQSAEAVESTDCISAHE